MIIQALQFFQKTLDWPVPIRRFSPPPRPKKEIKGPFISIIIPAHNEEKYIVQTLLNLQRQAYPHFETIVVANGCADDTAAMARPFCDRLVILPEKGLSRARNEGANKARGDLLIFLDADTQLHPGGLHVIAREFSPDCAAGTLKGLPDNPRLSFKVIYAFKNALHRFHLHSGSSGAILCWREEFARVGGFDEQLHVRENSHLIRRLLLSGKYKFIGDTPAVTSMRRYQNRGIFRTLGFWFKVWFQSLWGDLRDKPYESVR